MAAKTPSGPPDDDADAVVDRLTDEFRDRLTTEAEKIRYARGGAITAEVVEAAYRRLTVPTGGRSDAQKLVNTAFKENQFVEWTGYAMAVVLFLFGIALLLFGILGASDVGSRVASLVSGSVAELVLIIPLRFSINARRHNFGLRILAHLLDRVDDPALLSDCIRRLLGEVTPNSDRGEEKR